MAFVTGIVQRSSDNHPLGNATLADNLGNISSTDLNGGWYTYIAYPGYMVTASFPGLITKSTVFTAEEIASGWITILLDVPPPPQPSPPPPGW
jgi:hypothetical protein